MVLEERLRADARRVEKRMAGTDFDQLAGRVMEAAAKIEEEESNTMAVDPMGEYSIARDELAHAAVAYVRAMIDPREHAHSAAAAEYAEEQMCLAARRVTRSVEALPEDKQPVGWDASTEG